MPRLTTSQQSDSLGKRLGLGLEPPAQRRSRPRQVERIDDVGIGRDDEHRSVRYDRRGLVPTDDAGRKREGSADIPGPKWHPLQILQASFTNATACRPRADLRVLYARRVPSIVQAR